MMGLCKVWTITQQCRLRQGNRLRVTVASSVLFLSPLSSSEVGGNKRLCFRFSEVDGSFSFSSGGKIAHSL